MASFEDNDRAKAAQSRIMSEIEGMPFSNQQRLAILTSCVAELSLKITNYNLDETLEVNKRICRTLLAATIKAKQIYNKLNNCQ